MSEAISKSSLLFGPFKLFSPLSPSEGVARLQASPLQGTVKETYFRLCRRRQDVFEPVFRTSFKPFLFARIQESGSGTLMRCHFTLHPLALVALALMVPIFLSVALVVR